MPTRIGEKIATALKTDNTVTAKEAKAIIETAKAERKWTPELKAEVQALLSSSTTKFSGTAKADLQKFLDATPALKDLADPKVLTKHTDVGFFPVQDGKLYVDGVNYDDVAQGYIGDCYLSSATSAVAQTNPKAISDAIKDNGDGTYTVRFFDRSWTGTTKPVSVTIDGDVPAKTAGGTVYYQHARDSKELWPALIEKAYAQWKGGYEAIGNGGDAGAVMTALTGKASSSFSNSSLSTDQIYNKLKTATSSSHPVAAGTFGESQEALYTNTGVHANHAYTVLGVSEENGQKYVQLRNPWGFSEPTGNGKDDGIFKLPIADFKKLYANTMIGG